MSSTQLALFRETVTWPHSWRQGIYRHFSTRSGRVIGCDLETGAIVVRFRSAEYHVAAGDVRLVGQPTALTEAILGR